MDRKSIIVLVCSFILLMLWFPLINKLYPPKPAKTNDLSMARSIPLPPATNSSNVSMVVSPRPGESTNRSLAVSPANAPEEFLVLSNQNAFYTFTSRGGGLKLVELRRYPDVIACGLERKGIETNFASLNTRATLPTLALVSGEILSSNAHYKLTRTDTGVQAEHTSPSGLSVIKTFSLSTNYLVEAKVRIENKGPEPASLPAQQWIIGTATPMSPHDSGQALSILWFNGSSTEQIQETYFANRTLGCIPGTPRTQYEGGNSNITWAAVANQFFTLAAVPKQPATRVVSERILLPPPTAEQMAADSKAIKQPFAFQTAFLYPATLLATNQVIEKEFTIYAGPKDYYTLARLGAEMKNDLDQVMGFGGFFGFFAKMLLLSMRGLVSFGLTYGWAIIAITVIIKLVFWPLTTASTRSMKRMQALQPQLKVIQDKYKEDPKKMQAKMLEFYREHKINPVGSCLPMLLQIPVFFGFYRMLQSAIELRGAKFLWACDLSQPDTVAHISGFPVNPFPLIMGVTMLYQARLTPPSPGMDPAQQKMMKYMPLIFMVFLYNMSAGLTLYWTVQNLLTIVQTKLTKAGQDPATVKPVPATAPLRKKLK